MPTSQLRTRGWPCHHGLCKCGGVGRCLVYSTVNLEGKKRAPKATTAKPLKLWVEKKGQGNAGGAQGLGREACGSSTLSHWSHQQENKIPLDPVLHQSQQEQGSSSPRGTGEQLCFPCSSSGEQKCHLPPPSSPCVSGGSHNAPDHEITQ